MTGKADFSIPLHNDIACIIKRHLDMDLIGSAGLLFGGGTLCSMRHGEYRESVDIDFLCSDIKLFNRIKPESCKLTDLRLIRDPFVDKDAVRVWTEYSEKTFKIEFIYESRFKFSKPEVFLGVNALCDLDLLTCKLFAHADRGGSDIKQGKDITDIIAIYADNPDILDAAWNTAYSCYGSWLEKHITETFARGDIGRMMSECGIKKDRLAKFLKLVPELKEKLYLLIKKGHDDINPFFDLPEL